MLLRKPRTRAYHSIINYYWNEKPIVKSEMEFLNLADDFIILSGEQDKSFHSTLERYIVKSRIKLLKVRFFNADSFGRRTSFTNRYQNIISTPGTLAKTDDPSIRLLDKTKLNYLARAIAGVVSVILLMIPVCLLFKLEASDQFRLVIVLLFAFIYQAIISYLVKPDYYELFMATAA